MNLLNDLLYFTYIGGKEEKVIRMMYNIDPELFLTHLNQLFDIEFRNKIADVVGVPLIKDVEGTQKEINEIFTEIAWHLHFLISTKGIDFWHNRGVTDAQIEEFYLGDNHAFLSSSETSVPSQLPSYFRRLVREHRPELVRQVNQAFITQIQTGANLYGSGHAVCAPSFDSEGICRGIVFRTTQYEKPEGSASLKNIFKFSNSFSWSYLFNYKTFEEYDELIMVEGVFDVLALQRLGYKNVISPSMVRLSPYHTNLLKDKKLHVLFDKDRGGLEGLRFIKDHYENQDNLLTLALCPTEKDFDEMTEEEVIGFMDLVSDFDVRNLTSNPPPKHSLKKV